MKKAIRKVLVINSGSSSLKYQLFDMVKGERLAKGLVERIGCGGPERREKERRKKKEEQHGLVHVFKVRKIAREFIKFVGTYTYRP